MFAQCIGLSGPLHHVWSFQLHQCLCLSDGARSILKPHVLIMKSVVPKMIGTLIALGVIYAFIHPDKSPHGHGAI